MRDLLRCLDRRLHGGRLRWLVRRTRDLAGVRLRKGLTGGHGLGLRLLDGRGTLHGDGALRGHRGSTLRRDRHALRRYGPARGPRRSFLDGHRAALGRHLGLGSGHRGALGSSGRR
ncbi:hypothetical protein JTP67_30470, partial [Streptomyces sp. S12]|nr:hypothetical protein [Streptomyces sp. S12]